MRFVNPRYLCSFFLQTIKKHLCYANGGFILSVVNAHGLLIEEYGNCATKELHSTVVYLPWIWLILLVLLRTHIRQVVQERQMTHQQRDFLLEVKMVFKFFHPKTLRNWVPRRKNLLIICHAPIFLIHEPQGPLLTNCVLSLELNCLLLRGEHIKERSVQNSPNQGLGGHLLFYCKVKSVLSF